MSSASLESASEPTPSYDDVATRPPVAVRDGEMPGKSVESMSADEIAATQASEVAITVGDPVPAGEQNATVEIQGQPIGRSLSRQLTTSISGLQRSVSNPGAAAGNARARAEARVGSLPGAGVVGAVVCLFLVTGGVLITISGTIAAVLLNMYYTNEGKPCSTPISLWLYVSGFLVIATFGWNCIMNFLQCLNKKDGGDDDDEGGGKNGCVSCIVGLMGCGACLGAMFGFVWYILGMTWVFGNHAYNETQLTMIAAHDATGENPLGATADNDWNLEPAVTAYGDGCYPDLVNGAWTYYIVMFSISGGLPFVCCILACCCACVGGMAGSGGAPDMTQTNHQLQAMNAAVLATGAPHQESRGVAR